MADWEERYEEREEELYHCECAMLGCREKTPIGAQDYERIRQDSMLFIVVPGHEQEDVETVVERQEGWAVVRKDPEVQGLVDATDPRSD